MNQDGPGLIEVPSPRPPQIAKVVYVSHVKNLLSIIVPCTYINISSVTRYSQHVSTHQCVLQSHSRRRYTRCALGRLHFAHRRAEVRRSPITPDYFEDKRALIFSRRRRRDRAHSRARGCFEHMDFPEMCKLKCCESWLVKIATKLRKQRAN